MKYIGVTMRVDRHEKINECRDALDQRWYAFLKQCDLFPVLLPNSQDTIYFIQEFNLSGILLSPGNSLAMLKGDAIERDDLEVKIMNYAIQHNKPVLGVCRGMQIIQAYFGVVIEEVSDHVATRHDIDFNSKIVNVNSYHRYGAFSSTKELLIESKSSDGVIEAVTHCSYPVRGIMWHPEREEIFSRIDLEIFKKHFST